MEEREARHIEEYVRKQNRDKRLLSIFTIFHSLLSASKYIIYASSPKKRKEAYIHSEKRAKLV